MKKINPYSHLSFGERIRRLRRNKGWTQEQLAERAGCIEGTVSRIERCLEVPAIELMLRFANVFDLTLEELIGKSTEKHALHLCHVYFPQLFVNGNLPGFNPRVA